MPADPFNKSYDPKDKIDLPLFSLIHNDSAIAGAYELEGNQFQRTINYLDGYFGFLRRHGPLPEAASLLQRRMYKLLEIETELGKIRGLSYSFQTQPTAKDDLVRLSTSIARELLGRLGQGDYLSLPGGWLSSNGSHAMVYQFKRTAEGFEFYVHNSGAGINHHERQSAHDRELYYPVQAYKIPLPIDETSLAHFLRQLMLPMLPGLRAEKDQGFNAKQLYLSVFPHIYFLNSNASLISLTEKVEHALTAGQLSGSCAERCLHQMLKANFKSLQEYQHFIYSYKCYSLDDFMQVLTAEGQLGDRRAQSLVNDALNTMFRTLNIPGLFTQDQMIAERAALNVHRDALRRSRIPDDVRRSTVAAPRAPFKTIYTTLPTVLRPAVSQTSPSLLVDPSPLKTIVGGRDLLRQLDELRLDCERLKTTKQDLRIIEQLEQVFAHFPLPQSDEEFGYQIDFYQVINSENKDEFYTLIASLQALYLDACKEVCPDASLPRMLVVGLSVMSVLDYVQHQFPINEVRSAQSWHTITSRIFGRLFEYNQHNPYFATNNVLLDARLQSIKSLYSRSSYPDLLSYYKSIIDSEPHLKRALLARYKPPADVEFAQKLAAHDIRELYCFTNDVEALNAIAEYQPLIKKFNIQQSIESTLLTGLKPFLNHVAEIKKKITISWMFKQLSLSSAAHDVLDAAFDGNVSKQKYDLLTNTPCKRALDIDYSHCHNNQYTLVSGKRSDNHTQLFPSEAAQLNLTYLDAATKKGLSERQIDSYEIATRELFHLRGVPALQIKLTLDYFLNHLSKLSDSTYQHYVEANIFEPGLLAAELAKSPEILKQIDRFIKAGLEHYAERGLISEPSLFFVRLAYLVNQYATEQNATAANIERLDAWQKQLVILLQVNVDNEAAIKQSLHQYQFLTAMTRLTFKSSDAERQTSLELAIPSHFYMNAKSNPKAPMDAATQFERNHAEYRFKRQLIQSDGTRVGRLVVQALEHLHLGVCEGAPTQEGAFYTVKMKRSGVSTVYRVDVGCGLIFNAASGMAFSPVPLDISHHPVMQFLKPGNLESCFKSSDGNVFELTESGLRFIRRTHNSPYRVQKQWTVGGRTQWYELHDLSDAQKVTFNLESTTIKLPFPDILKQRDVQVWVDCDALKSILITENHRPAYQCLELSTISKATALSEDGLANGFTLCTEVTWLHRLFAKFESPEFITVCENRDSYQIKFGRYGLTLLASQEHGAWVYRLENNLGYELVGDIDPLIPGVAGLIFEDNVSHRKECYLPLQPFICAGGPSPRSEFHDFKQDISAAIPKDVVAKLKKLPNAPLLWQYTDSERVIRYQMDKEGQPYAETASDALYLCYVYLGSQNPEKAWAILEDCDRRLGGLKGTVEELSQLNLIMNALPRKIKDNDSKATIATPKYVACQLKALALLTRAFTPDKVISFPHKTFDLKTPDGLYQESCWDAIQDFYHEINGTVYSCYERYQNMQRHLMHDFHLTDAERKSLLDYYHFNLQGDEPKALGALGYEWQVLQLKTVRHEYETLKAEARAKGHLPVAYQKRQEEIGRFLQQDALIRAHRTDLKSVPIDLGIPADLRFTWYLVNDCNYSITSTWWHDIKKAPTREGDCVAAMKALTPDITEGVLIQHFACYYKLLTERSFDATVNERQAKITNFCHQYLKANRHVPLDKQESKATYLCNILYRIANNAQTLSASNLTSCSDIFRSAEKMPIPPVIVHQACHTTHTALAEAGREMIWDALKEEVPVPSIPMLTPPCEKLDDFCVEQLIDSCQLDGQEKHALTGFCQRYREQARIFGTAPVAAGIVVGTVLSSQEREAGRAQGVALSKMRSIACDMLSMPHVREALQDSAQDFMARLEAALQTQLEHSVLLANKGPADLKKKRCRDLEIEGGSRAPLDKQRLLALYFRADIAQYAMATGLSDAEIQQLHTGLSHFLGLAVRKQALQRFSDDLLKNDVKTTDLSALQQIAHGLFTENLVDAKTENPVDCETDDLVDPKTKPVLMLIQYYDNILLRPQQITAIKQLLTSPESSPYTFNEAIEKIIMGGGKSKVMLPVLAQSKATGNNLVVVEVPPALFETNCVDLAQTSGRLFNQKASPFQFNRDSDCSPKSLEFLHSKLIDVMVHRDYIVTTGDVVQSLELKYLELLLQRPQDEDKQEEWALQCKWLDKIVVLFRTRADVVIDEVHQGLLLKKKLNYTLGDKRLVPTSIIDESVEIYNFFEHVSLTGVLGAAFADKTLSSLLENNQLITQERQWMLVMDHLMQQLLDNPASPLQQTLRRMSFDDNDKKILLNYLANKGDSIPDCVLRSDKKAQIIFALYKEQVSQLLPQTLKRQLNVNYGVSQSNITSALAIPYVANNVPSERSRFGNYLESINFTIQMLMIGGFQPSLLKQYLQQLQVQARQELLKEPGRKTIDNTPTGSGFREWTQGFEFSLSELRLEDEQQFDKVFKALHKNEKLISEVLKANVLTRIQVESQILHSDAYNHVDIYRSCQGITGTPWNSSTYHQRLIFDKSTTAATDGFILDLLEGKETAIRQVSNPSLDDFFKGLFVGKKASESVRAIIDICASFKGISNLRVANKLTESIRLNPEQFSIPLPLKYVLFFNEDNVLCALATTLDSTPIMIGSTDPDVINAKLGCTPDERFSYYDQSHTVGVDLKQALGAKALVLVNHETHLQSFLQGCMRMRGLQDAQSVELIVPGNFEIPPLNELFLQMAANEERQLRQDNFSAAQAKMTNVIRADFMQRLLALSGDDIEKKHQFALAFKSYFVELESQDFFARYGGIVTACDAEDILMGQRDRLLNDWTTILEGLHAEGLETAKDQLAQGLDKIIKGALPICPGKFLSPTRQEQGREVEVQKQVLVEMQREAQREQQLFNPSFVPSRYEPWLGRSLQQDHTEAGGFLSLTALCAPGAQTLVPEFGEIYAGRNFYKSYDNQTKFLGPYLKPVHAILFRQRADGKLDSLMLSQREAEEIRQIMRESSLSNNIWLSTTQHTILEGKPPAGLKDNVTYQGMIEKIRFFNGEFRLLLEGDIPPNWLSEKTGQKLAFFKQNLLPYRETVSSEVVSLQQALSQKQNAYRYIAEHPLKEDYDSFDWTEISEELTDADIDECRNLAKAFARANQHWQIKSYDAKKCQEGLRLSIQASSYIHSYFDTKIMILRRAFPLFDEGHIDEGIKTDIHAVLPSLLKDFILSAQSKQQTPLQFLLKKASILQDNSTLMRIAEWLIRQKADINALDIDGRNALEYVIRANGAYVLKVVAWLFAKNTTCLIPKDVWCKVPPITLWSIFQRSKLDENESFLLACVDVFRRDETKLSDIITRCVALPTVLQKVIEVMDESLESVLPVLLANKQFIESAKLVRQLLVKVQPVLRKQVISSLSSGIALSSDVLTVIIEGSPGDVNGFLKLMSTHGGSFSATTLSGMIKALPLVGVEPPSSEITALLQDVVRHPLASSEVLEAAVNYTLRYKPEDMNRFWRDVNLQKWGAFDSKTLCKLFSKMTEAVRISVFNSDDFKHNQDSVLTKLAQSLEPAVLDTLFQYPGITLKSNHLMQMPLARLDAASLPGILVQMVKHAATDLVVLKKIVEVMGEPTKELLSALFANEIFKKSDVLIKQLLGRVQGEARQQVNVRLSAVSDPQPNILALIIENSNGDVKGATDIVNTHAARLNAGHLRTMVQKLEKMPAEPNPGEPLILLLQQIVGHAHADVAVLEQTVRYALRFESRLMERFWTKLSLQTWEDLTRDLLGQLFTRLNDNALSALVQSRAFITSSKFIIEKLNDTSTPGVFNKLLESPEIKLESRHLMMIMKALEGNWWNRQHPHVQAILLKIVKHPAVDQATLTNVIELMGESKAPLLLQALAANDQVKKSVALVKQLLDTLQGEPRKTVLADLSANAAMSSEMLTVIIEKSAGDDLNLTKVLRIHDNHLSENNLCAMVRALPQRHGFELPSVMRIDFLQKIIAHTSAETAALNAVVEYALTFNAQFMDNLWEKLSLQRWDSLDVATLSKLFEKISDQAKDGFFKSRRFTDNQELVINKLIQSANPTVYDVMLRNRHVNFESSQLMALLTTLDEEQVQAILPQLAEQPDVDEAILRKLIEVMSEPTEELLSALLANEQFITSVVFIKQLLGKVQGEERQKVLRKLSHLPRSQPDILELLIQENQCNVDELREILRLHPELNSKQLKLMLPKDVTAWRGKDMSTLLISILQHKHVDASISRAVVNCALAVVQPGMLFWEVIPEKMTKLDLSRNNLGSKLDDELRHILAALQSVVELDLSENNLSSKDSAILAKIFATMSSSVRRLDLSANNLDRKSMARIIHLMPAGVADIAIDQHKFMPRAVVKAQCTNYSFVLKCLAGIAMVTGAAMLIVGLLYLQPVLVQAGIGLMATVAVSVCLAGCGLFSTKDLKKTDKLEVVDAPHHSMF